MRIVEDKGSRVVVETASGVTLTCKAVRQLPVQHLLMKVGITEQLVKGGDADEMQAKLGQATAAQQVEIAQAAMALFNFVMGYGVEESPPQESVEELQALGVAPSNKTALRAVWLNYLVLEDGREAGELTGVILGLTFKPTE